jgi:hypothetical protein
MVCQPDRSLRCWIAAAGMLLLIVAEGGCQKSGEIAHYRVPKEQEVSIAMDAADAGATNGSAGNSEAADNAATDRMLAAIVPHGETAWFFKLSGPADSVSKYADAFETMIKSVKFSESAGGKPSWSVPEGWQQKPGSQMRFATIVLPSEATDAATKSASAKPLEVSVTSLPWSANDIAQQLLANVNRWRGQMQLKPLAAADLPQETKSLELPGEAKATATLVDLTGHMKAGGMQPPFATGATKTTSLPPGHLDVSNRLPPGHPSVADAAAANRSPMASAANDVAASEKGHPSLTAHAMPAAPETDLPFTFTKPTQWKPAALPTFAVAAFSVTDNSPRPEITITPLPAGAGGIEANVNRWRGQLGLSLASADELAAQAQSYEVDGQAAHRVRLMGPEDAKPRRAIMAVVVPHEGINWIIALKAEADVADREQDNFDQFVGSLKFRSTENKQTAK